MDNTDELRDKVFCLACETGREQSVAKIVSLFGSKPITAMTERIVVKNGVRKCEERPLLPGYVLFETADLDAELLGRLKSDSHFIKLLSYLDGDCALRGEDLEFITWLKRKQGVMEVSRVCKVGDRIRVIDGPLKDFEGNIVSVNRKRSCVAIQLSEHSVMNRIWCSIEYIEPSDSPAEPLNGCDYK